MIVTSIRYLTENIKNYKSLVKSGEIIVAEDEETSIVLVRTDKIKSMAEESKTKINSNYANYIGKRIRLYPSDTYSKYGIVKNVDEFGWTIKITESRCSSFEVGKEYFISHSKNFTFAFE